MQPHLQRVVEEKTELDKKIRSLESFVNENPIFVTLEQDEKIRMDRQFSIMCDYSAILGERLAAAGICPECYEDGMEVLDGVFGCGSCGHVPDAE